MAPTVAICRSSLGTQSREAMRYAKRNLASGIWECQPSTGPPMTSASSLGSSCTAQKKGSLHATAVALDVALDVSLAEGEEEAVALSVCETPKAKKHRIPVVDVDLCPPAPKKVRRAHSRLPVACSSERERSAFLQKLSFSPSYLF